MNRIRPKGDRLLGSLVQAAREDGPNPQLLNGTRAVLGLLGGSGAVGSASVAMAASGIDGVAGGSAAGPASATGAALGPSGIGAPSGVATLGPVAVAKWFAVGLVSGSVALGGAAVHETLVEPQRSTESAAVRDTSAMVPGTSNTVRKIVRSNRPWPRESAAVVPPGGQSDVSEVQRTPAPANVPEGRLPAGMSPYSSNALSARSASSDEASSVTPSIRRQLEAIETARLAMRNSDPAGAAATARWYLETFPDGLFVPEALYLTMNAHLQLGQVSAGHQTAQQLTDRFPKSVQSAKAREVLDRPRVTVRHDRGTASSASHSRPTRSAPAESGHE